ncbi:Hypothetical predicted protein [Marmota monax]|uniref:SH3 domain-containing protein n=1 Tax=Marmota monax TaxID=9995 RepID=A0A5E4ASL5_MARMO|nr:Hypothetical predicted protein [Marmota monax]
MATTGGPRTRRKSQANLAQIIQLLSQPPPQCKALYDFEVKDKKATDNDRLPFVKDDALTVIQRVDASCAEEMLEDKIEIFLISYVEFNLPAKHLTEWDQPPMSVVDAETCTSAAVQSSTALKHSNTKNNTKNHHSFISFTIANKSSHASQKCHSMEISPPVLISSSNPQLPQGSENCLGWAYFSASSQIHVSTAAFIVTQHLSSPVTTGPSFTFLLDVPSPGTFGTMNPPFPAPPSPGYHCPLTSTLPGAVMHLL